MLICFKRNHLLETPFFYFLYSSTPFKWIGFALKSITKVIFYIFLAAELLCLILVGVTITSFVSPHTPNSSFLNTYIFSMHFYFLSYYIAAAIIFDRFMHFDQLHHFLPLIFFSLLKKSSNRIFPVPMLPGPGQGV